MANLQHSWVKFVALLIAMAIIYWGVLGVVDSIIVKVNYRIERAETE